MYWLKGMLVFPAVLFLMFFLSTMDLDGFLRQRQKLLEWARIYQARMRWLEVLDLCGLSDGILAVGGHGRGHARIPVAKETVWEVMGMGLSYQGKDGLSIDVCEG